MEKSRHTAIVTSKIDLNRSYQIRHETLKTNKPSILDRFRLNGRTAWVVGGSRGLGRAIAEGLAQAGAATVISARSAEACEATAAAIQQDTGQTSVSLPLDVTDEAAVEAAAAQISEQHERLDILINSAGINIRHLIEDFPPADFKQIIDINLTGSWLTCRAVAPLMKQQGSGAVINIASALSTVGLAERTAYCSSKFGILGLTKTLALEWAASGVRCNAICPGPFLTELNQVLVENPEKGAVVVGKTAFNRWGELEEIQGAALFLASDASSYVTGTALYVDGGWTA